MKILIVGSGGREDALSWRLARSPSCAAVYHAPGNAGTVARGTNFGDVAPTDARALVDRARANAIDLIVIGPETALAAGVGDRLRDAGLRVFGPNRSGARLESSKTFAKRFMERHGIPTARYAVVHNAEQARKSLGRFRSAVVVKADGLAAGKGVVVCDDAAAAQTLVEDWYARAAVPGGGNDVVLEERLEGREMSVFAIADGRAMIPIAAACDYKRAGDGDRGPNTGGMGAYSPPAGFPGDAMEQVRERIIAPTLRGLLAEGEDYRGILYVGIMWTARGPSVIEYNARFGDPETQVLMPRVGGDLARLLASAADGILELDAAHFADRACVGVTLATNRYPYANTPLHGMPKLLDLPASCTAFWGNATIEGETIRSTGGRVLTVCATADTIMEARGRAYAAIEGLTSQFPAHTPLAYRSDIAGGLIESVRLSESR